MTFPSSVYSSPPPGPVTVQYNGLWFDHGSLSLVSSRALNGTSGTTMLSATPTAIEYSAGITGGSNPYSITVGPDGAFWFVERATSKIGRITTAGAASEFSMGITPGADPNGIVTGPDGSLWFGDSGTNEIGRVTTAGVITEYPASLSGGSSPQFPVQGPDGNMWYTEWNGARVAKFVF